MYEETEEPTVRRDPRIALEVAEYLARHLALSEAHADVLSGSLAEMRAKAAALRGGK